MNLEDANVFREIRDKKKEILNKVTQRKCLICGKNVDGLCNSHSIPAFVLKNIAKDGHVLRSSYFLPFVDKKDSYVGIKKAGRFFRICNDCDNIVFQKYEEEKNLLNKPDAQTMLAIALKIILTRIDADTFLKGTIDEANPLKYSEYDTKRKYTKINISEELNSLVRYRKGVFGKKNISFRLLYWKMIDYVVPIAAQASLCLHYDLENNVIFDTSSFDIHKKAEVIYTAVLPLSNSSIIMMFVDENNKLYDRFIAQLRKREENEQLEIINYLLFLLSDDVYLAPYLKLLEENKKFVFICNWEGFEPMEFESGLYKIKKRVSIPNLLNEKYKICK